MDKKITTLEDLQEYLKEIMEDPSKADQESLEKLKDLKLEPIVIRVSDVKHEHALSAEVLRTVVDYQDLIYKAIRIAKYGDLRAKLYEEDKTGFDLYVSFREGSILQQLDFQPILEAAVNKMNGWQSFGAFAIGILVMGIGYGFKKYLEYRHLSRQDLLRMQEKILSDKTNVELARINAKTVGDVIRLADDSNKTTSRLLEHLAFVDGTVEINGIALTRQELARMAKDNRESFMQGDKKLEDDEVEMTQVAGRFLVSRIELQMDDSSAAVDRRTVNLMNIDTGEVINGILVSGRNITACQRKMIMDAVDGKPLDMKMIISKNSKGKIVGTLLQECDGVSFKEPELF